MTTQKTNIHPEINQKHADNSEKTVTIKAVKTAVGIPAISPDSDKLISYWRDQSKEFLTELTKLRCLSGLLNGQNERNSIELSELCYLIDPSVDRLKDICDELTELFYKKQVAFIQPAGDKEVIRD
jgi:hypothetical protein